MSTEGARGSAARRGATLLQESFSSIPQVYFQELEQKIYDAASDKRAYSIRLKSLLFNLRANNDLLTEFKNGVISPAQLASMGPDEMASARHATLRKKVCDAGYAMNTLSSGELSIKVEKKTGGTKMEWFGADVEDDVDLVMSSSAECVMHRRKKTRIDNSAADIVANRAPSLDIFTTPLEGDSKPVVKNTCLQSDNDECKVFVSKRLRSSDVNEGTSAAQAAELLRQRRIRGIRHRSKNGAVFSGHTTPEGMKSRSQGLQTIYAVTSQTRPTQPCESTSPKQDKESSQPCDDHQEHKQTPSCDPVQRVQSKRREKEKVIQVVRPWLDVVNKTGHLSKQKYKDLMRSVVHTVLSSPPSDQWSGSMLAALVDEQYQQLCAP
eukprot:m.266074 g.266074  ORF g.266074 m.266074 type:complete len:380 (-) comp19716_c0_seq1:111-1250(-)